MVGVLTLNPNQIRQEYRPLFEGLQMSYGGYVGDYMEDYYRGY